MSKINKHHIIPIVSIAIAIISILISFYFYFNDKTPKLSITKIGEINVLEINRNLDELLILYNDADIKNSDNNIIIITFRIENNGSVNITKGLYDDILDWGIEINNVELLQAHLINSNSSYITENLDVSILQNIFLFSKVIFETNIHFDIEVVLLNNPETPPEYTMIGKIAGIDTEKVDIRLELPNTEKKYFHKIIDGNIFVHIGRSLFYFIILLIIGVIIGIFMILKDEVSGLIKQRKRKKEIEFLSSSITKGKYFVLISRFYLNNGMDDINKFLDFVIKEVKLREHIEENQLEEKLKNNHISYDSYMHHKKYLSLLKENDLLIIFENGVTVNNEFINEIQEFIKNIKYSRMVN